MRYILQMGYMTGDLFGVSAALILNPGLHLVFITSNNDSDSAKASKTLAFYRSAGLGTDRITVWDVTNTGAKLKGLYPILTGGDQPNQISMTDVDRLFSTESANGVIKMTSTANKPSGKDEKEKAVAAYLKGKYNLEGIHNVTQEVASAFAANPRRSVDAVTAAWGAGGAASLELMNFINDVIGDDFTSCVVLWSRQSGKNHGAHLELDSGFEGLRNLIEKLSTPDRSRCILLAGDDRSSEGQATKLQQIAASYALKGYKVRALGQFWNTTRFKEIFPEPMRRIGQGIIFKTLSRDLHNALVHVGMRSGNLEMFALLGMKVVYLDLAHGVTNERMQVFNEHGIEYKMVGINQSPSLTGQWGDKLSSGKDGNAQPASYSAWISRQETEAKAIAKAQLTKTPANGKPVQNPPAKQVNAVAKDPMVMAKALTALKAAQGSKGFTDADLDSIHVAVLQQLSNVSRY